MLSFCVDAPNHYEEAAKRAKLVSIDHCRPRAIVVAGMGGSAIGGELLKDWTKDKIAVPIEVCRDYSLPAYADRNTLVFVVSYSGETEESLSVFLDSLKRKCTVICVGSGGKLQDLSGKLRIPHLRVPSGMAPRAALPYLFVPLLIFLENAGLVSNVESEIRETISVLRQVSDLNSPKRLAEDNLSKSLASAICGTVPVIYGFGVFRAVAQRLKTQFNENSKIPAKWEFLPELDHNEIVGWEEAGKWAKLFSVVMIRDDGEPKEMKERIEITKELVCRDSLKVLEVWSRGKSTLAKMSSLICLGDFVSVYLAILRGVDPTPVKTITLLKERLERSGTKERVLHDLQAFV